jgi:hypothetical protein
MTKSSVRGRVGPPAWSVRVAGAAACGVLGAAPAWLSGRNRSARHLRARRLALHLAHVGLGATLNEAAGALARDRAAGRRACRAVEDARDVLAFDVGLDRLERALRIWCESFARDVAETAR